MKPPRFPVGPALALILAACAAPTATRVRQAAPPSPAPIEAPAPAPLILPRLAAPAPDYCGAAALKWLIGRPKADIPVPLYPGRRRVLCSTCPEGYEVVPSRLTILFDAISSKVTDVRCG